MNWSLAFTALLPLNLLLLTIVVMVLADVAGVRRIAWWLALAGVAAAAVAAAWLAQAPPPSPFPGQYTLTATAAQSMLVLLVLTLPVLLLARAQFDDARFYMLLLASLYGACLLPAADSFLTLFLALEILSLPVYVLVLIAFRRADSAEAALKYLVLGGTATATLLMGASLLFGASGSLSLDVFAQALNAGTHGSPLATAGLALVLVAFFIKAALVPFHTWAPDAYEGASTPVTAYMAVVVKAAVLLALVRLFGGLRAWGPAVGLLVLLPLVSMAWGNLAAMRQSSFRRMIAYSSIAHAGYLVFALVAGGGGRFQAVSFYLITYGLLTLLAFAALPVAAASTADEDGDQLSTLDGLWQRRPWAAAMIALSMLSLAGIPPLPGFIAKFLVFRTVFEAGYTAWAVLGLLASYLGIFFYLNIVRRMFMATPEQLARQGAGTAWAASGPAIAACVLCVVPAIGVAVFPGWLLGRL